MSAEVKKMVNFRSLTVTLAISFLALSATVLVISVSLNIYFTYRTQQDVIASQQQFIAEDAADKVRSFIQNKFSILESAVRVGDIITLNQGERKLLLEKLLGLEPSFRQLILLDAQEQELKRVSRLSGVISGQLVEVNMSELVSSVKEETYVSSVYIDEITSEPMIVMAVPVTDVFGEFEGTLIAEVNLKFMWDLVDGIKVGKKGVAYVVDKQGKLIAFGDIGRVLKGENLAHLGEVSEFVGGDELTHVSSADVSKGIHGTQVVANHAHLGKPDWAVVVEVPVEEAYENVNMITNLSLLVTFLSLVLALFSGVYLSKKITRPIISLRDAAVKIGEGKLDTQIKIKTRNEIGELATAFKEMTGDLKKSRKELEKHAKTLESEVRKRTRELESNVEELKRWRKITTGRELKMIELKKKIRELNGKSGKKQKL